MSQQTIITQFSQVGDLTSTIVADGRGYIRMQFRVGSAISNPSVVLSTMSMTIALQAKMNGGDDNIWCDVQTWAVASTESMAGRDFAYLVAEHRSEFRVYVKSFTSGICQARLWEC